MADRLCVLQYAAGRVEGCPADGRCPFWEEGGAVLDGGCELERLLPRLDRTPELAHRLLVLRRTRTGSELSQARSLFYRLLDSDRIGS